MKKLRFFCAKQLSLSVQATQSSAGDKPIVNVSSVVWLYYIITMNDTRGYMQAKMI